MPRNEFPQRNHRPNAIQRREKNCISDHAAGQIVRGVESMLKPMLKLKSVANCLGARGGTHTDDANRFSLKCNQFPLITTCCRSTCMKLNVKWIVSEQSVRARVPLAHSRLIVARIELCVTPIPVKIRNKTSIWCANQLSLSVWLRLPLPSAWWMRMARCLFARSFAFFFS